MNFSCDINKHCHATMLSKSFQQNSQPVRQRLHVAKLGQNELTVGRKKVQDTSAAQVINSCSIVGTFGKIRSMSCVDGCFVVRMRFVCVVWLLVKIPVGKSRCRIKCYYHFNFDEKHRSSICVSTSKFMHECRSSFCRVQWFDRSCCLCSLISSLRCFV